MNREEDGYLPPNSREKAGEKKRGKVRKIPIINTNAKKKKKTTLIVRNEGEVNKCENIIILT